MNCVFKWKILAYKNFNLMKNKEAHKDYQTTKSKILTIAIQM